MNREEGGDGELIKGKENHLSLTVAARGRKKSLKAYFFFFLNKLLAGHPTGIAKQDS